MLNYIDYLNMSGEIAICLVVLFFVIQVIGELLEFKGKAVPEFMKIRKYLARKKEDRETLNKMPETLGNVQKLLDDVNKHYSTDNIIMRDKWINKVNQKLDNNDKLISEIMDKLDRNNDVTISLLVDSKRNAIIDFASRVSNDSFSVTREQFSRVFRLYEEYEKLIEQHGLTNGEIDIAFRIITNSYEKHMKDHTFIEDVGGYGLKD